MSTLDELEAKIAKLAPEEFSELLRRMKERAAAAWDRQIEVDAKSGRLHALHARLQKEDGGDPVVPLDEFLAEDLAQPRPR